MTYEEKRVGYVISGASVDTYDSGVEQGNAGIDMPQRKPNRLKGYNYCQNGAYFVTICTKNKHEILWKTNYRTVGADIIRPQLSEIGMIIEQSIHKIPQTYQSVNIDFYVIMPNHIHMIVVIENDTVGSGRIISAPTSLSKAIGYFKQKVSRTVGFPLWQKSFHDHIIRNEKGYLQLAEYIENNPTTWQTDCFHPDAT